VKRPSTVLELPTSSASSIRGVASGAGMQVPAG
jgi:hypothetical protein